MRTTRDTALTPRTFSEALVFAKEIAKSNMIPQEYRGKPENVLLCVQWGAELGLSPLQALQSIAIINGKPSVYGDALIAICRGSPICVDIIERIEGKGEDRVAICEAHRRGSAIVARTFSITDAKAAGLWGKAGPWKQYPSRMLQMRARGFALRDAFPDLLRGVITVEEARDIPRGMVDVPPPPPQTLPPISIVCRRSRLPPVDGQVADKPVDETDALIPRPQACLSGPRCLNAWWQGLSVQRAT